VTEIIYFVHTVEHNILAEVIKQKCKDKQAPVESKRVPVLNCDTASKAAD